MGILEKKFYDYNLRAGDNIAPPIVAASVHGTPGAAQYSYRATFVTLVGESTPTEPIVVTTGNATLNADNYIRLTVDNAPAAASHIRFYKLSGQNYYLLQEVSAETLTFDDTGQQVQSTYLQSYTSNTSGRPQWRAVLFNPGKHLQRQELIDLQWILMRSLRDLGNITHRNGDVINGCQPVFDSGTTWRFTGGQIYIDGQIVDVPEGTVEITGTGVETVGLMITPDVESHLDDYHMRNHDEGVDLAYAEDGADRLVYLIAWGVDQAGQLDIQKFSENVVMAKTISPERTELIETLARRTRDVHGSFITEPFGLEALAHPSDETKCVIRIQRGKAYVDGYETETVGQRDISIPKGRDIRVYEDAMIGGYESYGGSFAASNQQNYNVDGLNVKIQVGSGYEHTVTLSGSGQTAAQVATQINDTINARKTTGQPDIIACSGLATGYLFLRAQADKSLSILSVSDDAYSILGLSLGTYTPTGTRIYEIFDANVKSVSSLSYSSEQVISLTYNGTIGGNTLSANVYDLVGASVAVADCHDGYFDYRENVDFRLGTYQGQKAILFDLGGSHPSGTYYLKLRESRAGVQGTRVLTTVTDEEIIKGSYQGADNLAYSDVLRITKVANSAGGANAWTEYTLKNNSSVMSHETSQVDWATAGAQGVGQPTTGAHYFVSYQYWNHTVEGDFVAADSYDNYDLIGLAPDETTLLRDCIDFRTTSTHRPENGEQTTFDYERYLPRFDKVALASDGTLGLISGISSVTPTVPPDQPGSLTVAQVYVPAYTYNASDMIIRNIGTLRTTQAGIKNLADDIDRLKYWQTVNNLENQTAYSDAAVGARGIFTDPVTGQNKLSWSFDKNGIKHTAAIDAKAREVKLPVTVAQRVVEVDEANCENIDFVGNYVVKGYQPVVYQQSIAASRKVNLNPDNIWNPFNGRLTLSPGFDMFEDRTQLPTATINYDNNMAAVLNILDADRIGQINWGQWNPTGNMQNIIRWWRPGWFAEWEQEELLRQGDQIDSIVPQTQLLDLGNRVADISLIQYARTTNPDSSPFTIQVTADSLMPNAEHGCEIAGIAVDLTPTGDSVAGTSLYNGKTTVDADATGHLTAEFVMPPKVPIGSPLVRLIHSTEGDASSGGAYFFCGGLNIHQQQTTLGMTTARVNTTCVSDRQWLDTRMIRGIYVDPLAETFTVEDDDTYISEVHTYFASKAAGTQHPVTCEIRTVLNGYATENVIQSVTIPASEITASANASVATVFKFTEVVSYQRGWYAVVLMTNCPDYEVWVSQLGDTDVNTGQIIRTQPYHGVFFHSPNGSTWQAVTTQDLKMVIKKSNFEQDASIVFKNLTGLQASHLVTKIEEFTGPGVQAHWYYSLDNGVSWIPHRPWLDSYLGSIASTVRLRCTVAGSNSGYALIKEFNGVVFLLHEATAEYISNQIYFTDPNNLPNQVKVYLDLLTDGINGTGARTVTPYYSVDDGETWCELYPPAGYNSIAKDNGFWEWEFSTRPTDGTITGASNATPIVITCADHGFRTNERVSITGVVGNTAANNTEGNPYWVVTRLNSSTFSLNGSSGSGSYQSGGTVGLATMEQCRLRVHLETSNQALTPVVREIRMICSERSN